MQSSRPIALLPIPKSTLSALTRAGYETVEDLLQVASPIYAKKRQELLYAELSKLSP